ncbi:hypothetical protein [Mycolicibacterium porcinum]|uniref:F5/8 type C domain-containing protein n=1 Tax=Mycolicibacterium porcinum TaxID=39693 RepID=A0ABV3VIP7_9MYCO
MTLNDHVSDEDWLAQVNAEYDAEQSGSVETASDIAELQPHNLDDLESDAEPANDTAGVALGDNASDVAHTEASTHPKRFDHKVAAGFGGLAAAGVVVALVAGVMFYSGGPEQQAVPRDTVADPAAVAVAKPVPPPRPSADSDRSIPYNADARGSCGVGSTSAQTMAGSDPRQAFVCVRGGADGQVITLDLSKTYVITAIKITPGWVGKDASDVSQWAQHRVVSTVQYTFNDVDRTPITQETGNVHGEAVVKIKRADGARGVVASNITMLIRQTSRPPAQPEPATEPNPGSNGGGLLPGVFGPASPSGAPVPTSNPFALGNSSANSDPVDAKFAISRLEVIGHEPN